MLMIAQFLLLTKTKQKHPGIKLNELSKLLQRKSLKFEFFKDKGCLFQQKNDQRNKTQKTFLIDNKVIKKSNEFKYLGPRIDSILSFKNHVKKVNDDGSNEKKN